jgi:hypothetical protein
MNVTNPSTIISNVTLNTKAVAVTVMLVFCYKANILKELSN